MPYGVRPGPPGLGPGMPIELPPDGLAACAQAGAEMPTARQSPRTQRRVKLARRSRAHSCKAWRLHRHARGSWVAHPEFHVPTQGFMLIFQCHLWLIARARVM